MRTVKRFRVLVEKNTERLNGIIRGLARRYGYSGPPGEPEDFWRSSMETALPALVRSLASPASLTRPLPECGWEGDPVCAAGLADGRRAAGRNYTLVYHLSLIKLIRHALLLYARETLGADPGAACLNVLNGFFDRFELGAGRAWEERLETRTLLDPLTGLYNRLFFEEEMRRLERGRDYPVTIIYGDLDDLKVVNDTLGHRQGDLLLMACARVFKASLRKSDILARLGGDEFAAILPRTAAKAACRIMERLRAGLDLYNSRHPDLPLRLSLGFATAAEHGCSLTEALHEADSLMYREKMFNKISARGPAISGLLSSLVVQADFTRVHATAR